MRLESTVAEACKRHSTAIADVTVGLLLAGRCFPLGAKLWHR